MWATTFGSIPVALSQFYPIPQFFASTYAVGVMNLLFSPVGGSGPWPPQVWVVSSTIDLLTATSLILFTGTVLIIVASVAEHVLVFPVSELRKPR